MVRPVLTVVAVCCLALCGATGIGAGTGFLGVGVETGTDSGISGSGVGVATDFERGERTASVDVVSRSTTGFSGRFTGRFDRRDSLPPPDPPASSDPSIVELYPNPVTYRDAGEFITVRFPPGSNASAVEVSDRYRTVSLSLGDRRPTRRTGTTVTFSTEPDLTASLLDRPIRPLSDRLRMANDGDRIRLYHEGALVDEVEYERAPRGQVYDASRDRWHALGASDRPVVSADGGSVETFVLPDDPDRAIEFLDAATDRILLAGYTVSSPRVVESLRDAVERGVTVQVLAEGAPVGGKSGHEAAALDELARAGIEVRVLGGDRARYRFHHPKYAIVDERALVTSENWKPAGVGGLSSRGWAVITDQPRIVRGLVGVFRADFDWVDAIPWVDYDPTLVTGERATGAHPQRFATKTVSVERTELLLAPDNAEEHVVRLIESAERSIEVKQVRIGDRGFPFLQALLDAAERGVEVRVLLSSAWYVEAENREMKAWLEEQAAEADLPLSVKKADSDAGFEKIHAKGLIVDDAVLVGSINWNNNSVRNNREVALVLHGDDVAEYFGEVFDADWEESGETDWQIPLGLGLTILVTAAAVVVGARHISFESAARTKVDPTGIERKRHR